MPSLPRHENLLQLQNQNSYYLTICLRSKTLWSIGMQDCKSAAILIVENSNLVINLETAKPSSVKKYQSAIGTHMYAITQTRLDFTYFVSTLSKFFANPSKEHLVAVK